jgi:hypothetical protein
MVDTSSGFRGKKRPCLDGDITTDVWLFRNRLRDDGVDWVRKGFSWEEMPENALVGIAIA